MSHCVDACHGASDRCVLREELAGKPDVEGVAGGHRRQVEGAIGEESGRNEDEGVDGDEGVDEGRLSTWSDSTPRGMFLLPSSGWGWYKASSCFSAAGGASESRIDKAACRSKE